MYELPTKLCGLNIRPDYRAILDIIKALDDRDLSDEEKAIITIKILFVEWEKIENLQEALEQAFSFINLGATKSSNNKAKLMDWEQDFPLIVSSINRILGKEIRSIDYLHWWTFIGAYQEIGDSVFSAVVNVRRKKAKGEKLDKVESDFYLENKELIDFRVKYSSEELEEINRLEGLLDN